MFKPYVDAYAVVSLCFIISIRIYFSEYAFKIWTTLVKWRQSNFTLEVSLIYLLSLKKVHFYH